MPVSSSEDNGRRDSEVLFLHSAADGTRKTTNGPGEPSASEVRVAHVLWQQHQASVVITSEQFGAGHTEGQTSLPRSVAVWPVNAEV